MNSIHEAQKPKLKTLSSDLGYRWGVGSPQQGEREAPAHSTRSRNLQEKKETEVRLTEKL